MFFPLFLLLLCSFLLEFTQAQEVSAKLDQCTADPAACKGYIAMGVCLAVGIPLIIWWMISRRRNKKKKAKEDDARAELKKQNDAVQTALTVARHKGKAERLDKFMELIGGGKEDDPSGAGGRNV